MIRTLGGKWYVCPETGHWACWCDRDAVRRHGLEVCSADDAEILDSIQLHAGWGAAKNAWERCIAQGDAETSLWDQRETLVSEYEIVAL